MSTTMRSFADCKEIIGRFQEDLRNAANDEENPDALTNRINADVLSYEKKIHIEVTLELGGPTSWIDFECGEDDGGRYLISATYRYRWGSERQDVELFSEDAEELYELLGIEYA